MRTTRLPLLWWRVTVVLSAAAGGAGLLGLVAAGRVYRSETEALYDVVGAQDVVTVLLVVPMTLLLGRAARRGALPALLCLPGCLAFLAYNAAIYTFSIHFGPLFLVWVAVLGLSVFALAGSLAALDPELVRQRFASRAVPGTAWCLMVVAALFALLWMREIVPDLLAGDPSSSAAVWRVPTNPVHVLDLGLFLPAVLVSGALLLHRHALGYATAAGQLVWMALTCVPILVTPLVSATRGHETDWAATAPVSILLVTLLVVLSRFLPLLDEVALRDQSPLRTG